MCVCGIRETETVRQVGRRHYEVQMAGMGGQVITASQDESSAEQMENKEAIKPYCNCFYTSNSFYTDAYEP